MILVGSTLLTVVLTALLSPRQPAAPDLATAPGLATMDEQYAAIPAGPALTGASRKIG